jgi:hypothetical protein
MSKLPDQNCGNCPNNHKCSEVYENLTKSDCNPVTRDVSIAFLLPMIVFILTIALFEEFCPDIFESKTIRTLVSLLCALTLAVVSVKSVKGVKSAKSGKGGRKFETFEKEFVEKVKE